MKKREVSLTNSDYRCHPSHNPMIQISLFLFSLGIHPITRFQYHIYPLIRNSKILSSLLPTNSSSLVPVLKCHELDFHFFFFYKESFKFEPFYLHISLPCHAHHHSQGGDVRSPLSLQPAAFPPPHSDSPYFQAPSFLMLPTATASNCFFHFHSRFPTRHCLQSPGRFKKCKSDDVAVCLKLLMTFPLFCSQTPPQGPCLARLRTSRGKGLELCSHLTLSKPGQCLLYLHVFVCRCVY